VLTQLEVETELLDKIRNMQLRFFGHVKRGNNIIKYLHKEKEEGNNIDGKDLKRVYHHDSRQNCVETVHDDDDISGPGPDPVALAVYLR
jgi:hypothetical protein